VWGFGIEGVFYLDYVLDVPKPGLVWACVYAQNKVHELDGYDENSLGQACCQSEQQSLEKGSFSGLEFMGLTV
jgi:hypothetical protein